MRTDKLPKTAWEEIDDSIRPLVNRTLGLPSNAANEYLFGAREDGLFAIPLAAEDYDIAIIDGGFKLLTSKDPIIHDMAWTELIEDANYRYQSTRTSNPQNFLNKEPSERTRNHYKSQWTRARIATDHLKIKWSISENNEAEILARDELITKNGKLFSKS